MSTFGSVGTPANVIWLRTSRTSTDRSLAYSDEHSTYLHVTLAKRKICLSVSFWSANFVHPTLSCY